MAPSVEQQELDAVLPIPVIPEDYACRMFIAGFRDCADEVLRYLTEVENMAEDDPVIVGLRDHLLQQEEERRWRVCFDCGETERERCRRIPDVCVSKASLPVTPLNMASEFCHGLNDADSLQNYQSLTDTTDYQYYSESNAIPDTSIVEVIDSVLFSNNLTATPELLQELIDGLCEDMTDSDYSGCESMDED